MPSEQVQISSDNQGPIVNAVAWVFMVMMILAVLTKVVNRWQRTRSLMIDDLWIMLAATFAVGQTIAVSEQVAAGLGQPWASLDTVKVPKYEKANYASQMLYALALCFAKLTTSSFVIELAPVQWVIWSMRGFLAFVSVWTLCAVLVIAFQCGLPEPWHNERARCIHQAPFWSVFGTVDILTDACLILMPLVIVGALQATRRKRFEITAAFAVRILNIPLIILRLVYLIPALHSGSDSSSMFRAALVTEIQMHFGLVLTCAPFIKAVIDSMQHGVIAGDMAYATETGSKGMFPGTSYELKKYSKNISGQNIRHAEPRSTSPQRLGRLEHPYTEISSKADARVLSRSEESEPPGLDQIAVKTTITTELDKQAKSSSQTDFGVAR